MDIKKITLILLLGFSLFAGCTQNQKESEQKIKPVEPSMEDECSICGMMPAKYPQWNAQVVLKDGERYHFDSPKDMFRFILGLSNKNEPKQWVEKGEIAAAFVTDHSSGEYVDATEAFYVKGSDARGPMGEDLVPFADSSEAMNFAKEHGGKVSGYSDVDRELVKSLKMGGMENMEGM